MDFRQRIIDELKLTPLQADTLLKDYIEVCEKLAKEYHSIQLMQTAVVGQSEQLVCDLCNEYGWITENKMDILEHRLCKCDKAN